MNSDPFPTIYKTNEFQKTYFNINATQVDWYGNFSMRIAVENAAVFPKT
jgi:hypothetical protein